MAIKRICIETGCGQLYDRDTTPGQRCPEHQQQHDTTRNTRPPRQQRGYDSNHYRLLHQLRAAFQPGQPCPACSRPILTITDTRLAHTDDRTGYLGLTHIRCNQATATIKAGKPLHGYTIR